MTHLTFYGAWMTHSNCMSCRFYIHHIDDMAVYFRREEINSKVTNKRGLEQKAKRRWECRFYRAIQTTSLWLLCSNGFFPVSSSVSSSPDQTFAQKWRRRKKRRNPKSSKRHHFGFGWQRQWSLETISCCKLVTFDPVTSIVTAIN